jgi:hypothetical protein
MRKHILLSCPVVKKFQASTRRAIDQPGISRFLSSTPKAVGQEEINEQTLKYFISGNTAFNQGSNPELTKLLKLAQLAKVEIKAPSRKVLRDRLQKHYLVADSDLKETFKALDSKISLALDAWSTRGMRAFLGTSL